jgi:hypothetical protein
LLDIEESDDEAGSSLNKGKQAKTPKPIPNLIRAPLIVRMAGETGGKTQLSNRMRLNGEENYAAWKEAVEDLAKANGLRKFIYKRGKAPEEANEDKLVYWNI